MGAWASATLLAAVVQGTVTLQGKPVAGARVEACRDRFFHPAARRVASLTGGKGAFRVELGGGAAGIFLRASYEAATTSDAFAALESATVAAAPETSLPLDRSEGRPATFEELEAAASGRPAPAPWREALAHALAVRDARAARNAEEVFAYTVRTAASRALARLAAREAAAAAEPLCALAADATSCLVGLATLAEVAGPAAVGRVKEARAALARDPREAARLYGEGAELHLRAGDPYRRAEALAGRSRALLAAGLGEEAAGEARREASLRAEVEDRCGEGAALALAGRAAASADREELLRRGMELLKPCVDPGDGLGVARAEDLLWAAHALAGRAEMESVAETAARIDGAHLAAARVFEALERWSEAAQRYRLAGPGEAVRRDLLRVLTRTGSEEAVGLAREMRDPVAEGEAGVAWARQLLDAGRSEEARRALLDAGVAFDAAGRPRDADAARRLYPQLEAARGDRLCAEGRHAEEATARAAAAFHYRKLGEHAARAEQLFLRLIALVDAGDALAVEAAAQELEDLYGAPGLRAAWEERLLRVRADPAAQARDREAVQREEPRRRLAQVHFWGASARDLQGRTTAPADLEEAARRLEAVGEAEGARRAYHRAARAYARAGDAARATACRAKAPVDGDPKELAALAEADRALVAGDAAGAARALARARGARPAPRPVPPPARDKAALPADEDPPWLYVARHEWAQAVRDRRAQRLAEMADVLEAAGDPAARDALSALAGLLGRTGAAGAAAAASARAAAPRASPLAPLLIALALRRPLEWEPPGAAATERLPPYVYDPLPGDATATALEALLASRATAGP